MRTRLAVQTGPTARSGWRCGSGLRCSRGCAGEELDEPERGAVTEAEIETVTEAVIEAEPEASEKPKKGKARGKKA